MRVRLVAAVCAWLLALPVQAQDLGPNVRKIKDGIYVYAAKAQDSNVSIIQTREGVVMIDTGQTPADSHAVAGIVKKLTSQPVRFPNHSEADTAIWLPKERILWAAASVGVKRYPNIRPFLSIPDILAAIKSMRALNPEIVIAGHGAPGTTRIFDEMERYYALLLERVGGMARDGKTLEQIKAELKMPEFDDWAGKARFPSNVDAA
jgi:glyoxylase-like metal-dependent hydrolase (beta-lactamase superfamily II)